MLLDCFGALVPAWAAALGLVAYLVGFWLLNKTVTTRVLGDDPSPLAHQLLFGALFSWPVWLVGAAFAALFDGTVCLVVAVIDTLGPDAIQAQADALPEDL